MVVCNLLYKFLSNRCPCPAPLRGPHRLCFLIFADIEMESVSDYSLLGDLQDEILAQVIRAGDFRCILQCRLVCRRWRNKLDPVFLGQLCLRRAEVLENVRRQQINRLADFFSTDEPWKRFKEEVLDQLPAKMMQAFWNLESSVTFTKSSLLAPQLTSRLHPSVINSWFANNNSIQNKYLEQFKAAGYTHLQMGFTTMNGEVMLRFEALGRNHDNKNNNNPVHRN